MKKFKNSRLSTVSRKLQTLALNTGVFVILQINGGSRSLVTSSLKLTTVASSIYFNLREQLSCSDELSFI